MPCPSPGTRSSRVHPFDQWDASRSSQALRPRTTWRLYGQSFCLNSWMDFGNTKCIIHIMMKAFSTTCTSVDPKQFAWHMETKKGRDPESRTPPVTLGRTPLKKELRTPNSVLFVDFLCFFLYIYVSKIQYWMILCSCWWFSHPV